MPLSASAWQGTTSFKPEYTYRTPNYRTPSPPLAYIEPVSPQAPLFSQDGSFVASSKKRKLRGSNHNPKYQHSYPHENPQSRLERPSPLDRAPPSFSFQTSPSPLDVFAAVATSPDIDKQFSEPHLNGDSDPRNGFGEPRSHPIPKHRFAERGSKRTLSEVIDVRTLALSEARPASSHVPQSTWPQYTPHYNDNSSSLQDLRSDAELLLGFSMASRAQSAQLKTYPPPLIEDHHYRGSQNRNFGYESISSRPADRLPHSYNSANDKMYRQPVYQYNTDRWQQAPEQGTHQSNLPVVPPLDHRAELARQPPQVTIEESEPTPPTITPEVKPRVYRGWPKGKPRGPRNPNGENKKAKKAAIPKKAASGRSSTRKAKQAAQSISATPLAVVHVNKARRHSFSGHAAQRIAVSGQSPRAASLPREIAMVVGQPVRDKPGASEQNIAANICASCNNTKLSDSLHELWINCNGCDRWFHSDCVGFETERKIKEVDKFFCADCESVHGPTTYVRKSTRAHANVDYAGLHEGKIRTAADATEHHYIQPIKDGQIEFLPETFARLPPELVTADFFERSSMTEPVVIPASLNPRPFGPDEIPGSAELSMEAGADTEDWFDAALHYECVPNFGQDKLDMVIPHGLTVRRAAELYGPEEKVEVIDVKLQEGEDRRWNMRQWADYYEAEGEKPVRNVISLEVSQSKLGRLIRRPKVVRDLDLQDAVWPQEESAKGIFPKVQFYCLMSVADCYTDFHIDFGGSSVYYHIIKGRKTFFFIPPRPENLKKYEKWCNAPDQNNVFLGNETKECYRVDLYPGDTMLIPSGWIHAVWTPENSLVIGGNFLTRMHYGMQIQINDIEKNTGVGRKFRYPYFQKILWHAVVQYLEQDPIPLEVAEALCQGAQFERKMPIYLAFDNELTAEDMPEFFNARYYSRAELDGVQDLLRYVYRTVLIVLGKVPGVAKTTQDAVLRSMPKGFGEHVDILKTFAMWVAWKRGNESIPSWALPGAELPDVEAAVHVEKKKSAAAIKRSERQSAREQFAALVEKRPLRQASSASVQHGGGDSKTESASMVADQSPQDPKSSGQVEQNLDERFGIRLPLPTLATAAPVALESSLTPKQANEERAVPPVSTSPLPEVEDSLISREQEVPKPLPLTPNERMPVESIKSIHQVQQLLPAINPSTESKYDGLSTMKPTRSKACAQCRLSKRRCVHDENGRIDPVKAQVPSVPRGPRKRWPDGEFEPSEANKRIKSEEDRLAGMDENYQTNPYWSAGHDTSMADLDLGGHARSLGLLPPGTVSFTSSPATNLPQQGTSLYPEEPLSWLQQSSPYPETSQVMGSNIDPALSSIDPALESAIAVAPMATKGTMQPSDPRKSRTPSLQVQGNTSTESAATSESRPSSPLTDVDSGFHLTSGSRGAASKKSNGVAKPASESRKTSRGMADTPKLSPLNQMHGSGKRSTSVAMDDGDEDESSKLIRELSAEQFGLRRRS